MSYKYIRTEDRNGYRILSLDRGKANAMNAQLLSELRQAVAEAAAEAAVGGLILTGKEHFFTAGLDVVELYDYDEPTIKAFWEDFGRMKVDLLTFPKPLICAIPGHSPAGGCIMAICCDYRVMAAGKYRIGLNEIPVGIVIPDYVFDMYAFWLGKNVAYTALLEGKLFVPEEALSAGLVNEVVAMEEVLPQAEAKMQQYLSYDAETWQKSKQLLRAGLVQRIKDRSEITIQNTVQHWWSAGARARLKALVQQLQKR